MPLTKILSFPKSFASWVGAGALCLLGFQSTWANDFADIETNIRQVSFYPDQAYDAITITVSGPNYFYRQMVFAKGELPEVSLTGSYVKDGLYHYELSGFKLLNRDALNALLRVRASENLDLFYEVFREYGAPGESVFQHGDLLLREGKITPLNNQNVERDLTAADYKDVLHADDTIVQGSICVGFDCVNNENFGADTIRLKENNLRIHFDDTSSTGAFPSNDWRIVANDQASGGSSYLAIEDTTGGRTPFKVSAGAPSNSLLMSTNGNIGLGTASPVLDMHIVNGNTPAIRLEQDASSGFSAQTWDVAANETNFFIRDVTNGSKLPFKIRPGAPNNSLYLNSDGNVGIGSSAPATQLHVYGSSAAATVQNSNATTADRNLLLLSNNGGVQLDFQNTNKNTTWRIQSTDSTDAFSVATGTTGGTITDALNLSKDANLTITDQYATTNANRDVLSLVNYGGVQVDLKNTFLTKTWRIASSGSGNFFIGNGDTGGSIGTRFTLDTSGNLTIPGNLTSANYSKMKADAENSSKKVEQLEAKVKTLEERIEALEKRLLNQ